MHAVIESRSDNGRDSEGGKENETCTFGETGTFLWNLIGIFGDLYIWGTGMFGTLKCLAEMYRYVFKKSPSVCINCKEEEDFIRQRSNMRARLADLGRYGTSLTISN